MSGMLDLDSLLSQSLEAVEAAPEFVTPENGVYILAVKKMEPKKRTAKDKAKALAEGKATEWYDLVLTYTIEATVALEKEGEALPVRNGSLLQEQFQFTEKGLPHFKSRTTAIGIAMGVDADTVGSMTVKEIMDSFPGTARFQVTLKKVTETFEGKIFEKTRFGQIVAVAE